jgi:hypothetical protein
MTIKPNFARVRATFIMFGMLKMPLHRMSESVFQVQD